MKMIRKNISIPYDQNELLRELAYTTRKTEVEIIRKILAENLPAMIMREKKAVEFD